MINHRFYFFRFFIILSVFVFALSGPCFGSGGEVGKIISKNEADAQFGAVLYSISFPVSQVKNWSAACNPYIMFNIMNNQLYVLNSARAVILPAGGSVRAADVFHVYSVSKLTELLSLGGKDVVSFEVRKSVFSITNGNYTLEFSSYCPPLCY